MELSTARAMPIIISLNGWLVGVVGENEHMLAHTHAPIDDHDVCKV